MELKSLYAFVLLIVMVGAIIGVGGITLANFAAQINNTNANAANAINASNTALGTIGGTWLPLIIVIAVGYASMKILTNRYVWQLFLHWLFQVSLVVEQVGSRETGT